MEILLKRIARKERYTIGHLYINGKRFCDTLEDHDRLYYGKPKVKGETAIPCGRYEVLLNVYSPRFGAKEPYKSLCGGCVPLINNVPDFNGVRIHCLTPDMEILTTNGWQNYESFINNPASKCFSYNTESGTIEVKPINFVVEDEYNGIIYENVGHRINYSVTDKHKMYVETLKHGKAREWQWRNADDIPYGARFLTSANKEEGWELTTSQKILYRILMATQADGYILNYSTNSSQVRFHFTKERKIQRIKQLVTELGETYTEFVDKEGKTHIKLSASLSNCIAEFLNPCRLVVNTKELPIELLNLKGADMKDLLMEYLFWDGRYENYLKNNLNMIITSTNIRTLNILQAMAAMCGMRSSLKLERAKDGNCSNCWDLILYENQDVIIPSNDTFTTRNYNGKVWCINNDNHTIIARQNGRTVILGNCGNRHTETDGCVLVGINSVEGMVLDSRKTFTNLMKKYLIPARQRKEKVYITIE